MKTRSLIHACCSILALSSTISAQARLQWTDDGKRIATATTSQVHLDAAGDGRGGLFLTWEDNPEGDINILTQWIDGSGNLRWGSGGVLVNSAGLNQSHPSISPDDAGGVFIAWQDEGSENIYAQRIDANGTLLWGTWGKVVCSASGEQSLVRTVPDGNGGMILVWLDKRNFSNTVLYAQRVDDTGTPQWTPNGIPVTSMTGNQASHAVVEDGSGGAFVVWQDYNGSDYDIHAQHLTSTGAKAWGSNGQPVVVSIGNQISPSVVRSNGNLIVSWDDSRSGSSDIYAQAFDAAGSPLWNPNGAPVSTASGGQSTNRITDDGSGGAIITWTDNRTGYDIYAQRMDAGGNAVWTINGNPVNTSDLYQYAPEIVSDGTGGAFIVWNDNRTGANIELYGQHIDDDGVCQWTDEGLPIVTMTDAQQNQILISDESGGFMTFWQDGRDGRSDIYAQHINGNLSFTYPAADTLWGGGIEHQIVWALRKTETRFDHFNIRASSNPGDGFPVLIESNVGADQTTQAWTPTGINGIGVTIKIEACDAQDSVLCEYISGVFTVDSEPPVPFDLSSPADGIVGDLNPTFEWESSSDALSGLDHYELWLDGTLFQDDIQTTEYTLNESQTLVPATVTWTVMAVDSAGLKRSASETRSYHASQDQTPPEPFLLLSPAHNAWTAETHPTFSWEASSDSGTGIRKYEFYLDGQRIIDHMPPSQLSTSAVPLTNGEHEWAVHAVDSCNNSRASETRTIRLDDIPPHPFALVEPADNVWIANPAPGLRWESTADSSIGIGLMEYQVWMDGSLLIDHIPGDDSQVTLTGDQVPDDGPHPWTVIAKDSLGNARTAAEGFTLKIDNTPPGMFTLDSPADGNFVTTAIPELSWQASVDATSGLDVYELWIDDALNMSGISGTQSSPASPLSEGNHAWSVRAFDKAGNTRDSESFSFTVDITPPESFNLISPADDDTVHSQTPELIWNSTNDLISGFDRFELFINDEKQADYLSDQDTVFVLPDPLENGPYIWYVKAYDLAGNSRTSPSARFIVSCNPPHITSAGAVQATEDIFFTYTATATDPDQDDVDFSFHDIPGWLTPAPPVISGTPTEGKQDTSFLIVATDGIYADSLLVTLNVQPVNDPPVITSPASVSATEDIPFSYTATADDPENDAVFFDFADAPAWLIPSGNRISGTPTEGTPDAVFTVYASDGQLMDTLFVQVTVIPVNDPPVITSPASTGAVEDIPFSYTATADDPENDAVFFNFADFPHWLNPSGNQISGTPAEGDTDTIFTVIASDGQLTDTLFVWLTVTAVNDPPVITSPAGANATEDIPFTYTATADDPENDTVFFDFANYPVWLTPEGNRISGTPEEGIRDGAFTVFASDGQLMDTLFVQVTVIPVNDPPVITSASVANAVEDTPFSYTATADDPENDTVTFDFIDAPAWLVPDGSRITGTPTEGILDGAFTVIASDGQLTDTLIVSVTVTAVNDPPVITSASVANAVEDTPFSYTATADDPENDTVTFDFVDAAAWLVPDGSRITGTPTEGIHDGAFTVIASDGQLTDTLVVSVTVTAVNDPPVITSPSGVSATEDIPFSYTASAEDPENDPVSFHLTDAPVWLDAAGSRFFGTPAEGDLDTLFTIVASDGDLTDTLTVTVDVIPVNDPPSIVSADTSVATEDIPFLYTPSAIDPEGDSLRFTFSRYPSWLTPGDTAISGTPIEGCQDTSFCLIASDASLSDTLIVSIIVNPVNDAPEITSADSVTAIEGTPFRYRASATDVDGPRLTLSFADQPSWLTPSGPEITGIPPNQCQDTTFKVIASDTHLSDTVTVTISIIPVNDPPRFDYALPHLLFSDLDSLNWKIDLDDYVSDPDDADSLLTWSYELENPTSLAVGIDTTTHIAVISGHLGIGQVSIAFTVTDPIGASASDTLQVSIVRTGVDDHLIGAAPLDFILYNNYPNPFNPQTTIRYGIPRTCHVELTVYNMLGQVVEVLVDDKQPAGTYEFSWDGSVVPSGVYLYRIRTESWHRVGRMILMK